MHDSTYFESYTSCVDSTGSQASRLSADTSESGDPLRPMHIRLVFEEHELRLVGYSSNLTLLNAFAVDGMSVLACMAQTTEPS